MLRDVMRETWAYQQLPSEGQEEEMPLRVQQAFVQGLQQAQKEILQELRHTLLKIVRARFPGALRLAKKQTQEIDDASTLRELIVNVATAASLDEAVVALLDVDEDDIDDE
jgi:hypothetical protein